MKYLESKMEWNENFKIGVTSVDAQHKELVNLLNKLQASIKNGNEQGAFNNTIRALVDYTNYHFSTEEAYMQSVGYPKLDRHKQIHQKLISDVKGILISLKQGNPVRPISLLRFLNDWVSKHILEDDLDIGKFVHHHVTSKYPETSNPGFPENRLDELAAEIQSLSKQRQHGAITESEYCIKCSDLIDNHFSFDVSDKIAALSRALSCMESLAANEKITRTDKNYFNYVLLQKAISQNVWSCFSDNNSKLRFLKNMRDDNIITSEDYEIFKKDCF